MHSYSRERQVLFECYFLCSPFAQQQQEQQYKLLEMQQLMQLRDPKLA